MWMFLFYVALLTTACSTARGTLPSSRFGSNGDQYERRIISKRHSHHREIFPSEEGSHGSAADLKDRSSKDVEATTTDTENRSKRSYIPYTSYNYQLPQFQSISAWRPSLYPLQRPYYIPIYGIDGRIPIYFPQQPIYLNPGTPPRNPSRPPYVGPTYLPPATQPPPITPTPTPKENSTMSTDNRFGGNDDDDRPIWDNGETNTQRPVAPTRKPTQAPQTFPPLVHNEASDRNRTPAGQGRPRQPTTTTEAPSRQIPGPSRCVWAIVSCCSTASKEVSYNCFEQFGCAGPFWDTSPCETEYAKAAIETALNYYNSRS